MVRGDGEQRAPPALRNACAKSSLQQIKTVPKIPCPAFAAPAAAWVWGHVCNLGVSGSPVTSEQGGKGRNLVPQTWYPWEVEC